MNSVALEVWFVVDANGDFGLGKGKDEAIGNYEDEIQDLKLVEGLRIVKLMLHIPKPEIIEMSM